MAVIKGLNGENATVSVGSRTQKFRDYGTFSNEITFEAVQRRAITLNDETADSVEVVTYPEGAEMRQMPNGLLRLDLNETDSTDDLTFTYRRKWGGGRDDLIQATVSVAEAERGLGWGVAGYYYPELDANDAVVVEPDESTRLVHVSTTGLSFTDIDALEGLTEGTVTGTWLRDNTATGQGGLYYGETEALALDAEAAGYLIKRLVTDYEFTSPWLLLKRGDTFNPEYISGNLSNVLGISALHPILVGDYGDSADDAPAFSIEERLGVDGSNLVLRGIFSVHGFDLTSHSQNVVFDDLRVEYEGLEVGDYKYPMTIDIGTHYNYGITVRRFYCTDAYYQGQPGDEASVWHFQNGDRISGAFIDNCLGLLVEKIFVDHAGWGDGYRMDRDGTYPKSPEDRSHGIYFQTKQADLTVRDGLFVRNSHSAFQMRPGGIVDNCFAAGNNTGINPAGGIRDIGGYGSFANWSMVYRYVQTDGGFKDCLKDDHTAGLPVIAGGLAVSTSRATITDSIIINAGTWSQFSASTDIGPLSFEETPGSTKYFPIRYDTDNHTGEQSWLARDELIVSNWNRAIFGDSNVDAVAEATRDALTIGAYTDDLLSTTGSDLDDLAEHLRTLDAPWELVSDINDYFLGPFGKARPVRSTSQTVTFLPDPAGETPGIRADLAMDWDTGDLPGTVDGDSVDLDGYHVIWNMTPANDIDDVTFGVGGALVVKGGIVKPTGSLIVDDAGNDLTIDNGAKVYVGGYDSTGILSVTAREGRFLNTGTVTGPIDITSHYGSEIVFGLDASSYTLNGAVTLYGHTRAGFDGDQAEAASLAISAGSTLSFAPAIRFAVAGMTTGGGIGPDPNVQTAQIRPQVGAVVTGQTSGATGVVRFAYITSNVSCYLVLDALTGVFVDGETLTAESHMGPIPVGSTDFGTMDGTPEHVLPKIETFRTGINGFTDPDVTTTVTLGGTLHVDVTGLDNGTYTLIEADTVSGTFDAVTSAGNSAKDLAIAISGTQVTVTITDGSGGVSGGI